MMTTSGSVRRGLWIGRAVGLMMFVVGFLGITPDTEGAIVLLLDPADTYFRVSPVDQAGTGDANPIRLANYGIVAGDLLFIESMGDHQFIGLNRPEDETGARYVGVFSATDVLLDEDQAHRVPGAIAVPGFSFVTRETFTQDPINNPALVTDIPEDFSIHEGVTIVVPEGAAFLFLSNDEQRFSDDFDLDADNGVKITILTVPVPAALPMGLVLLGVLGLKRRGRGR